MIGYIKTPGLADILDIICVAFLVYTLLVWFKKTKAAFVARGLLILTGVYAFARVMGMHMTTWIFQGFFAIFLIAVVIIFQEEIRHVFERIAIWSFRGGANEETSPRQVEILVRTLATLSRSKTGALIVLRGRDPLDRHAEAGWELQGQLSEPLLESIFDSHSLGHDGALLIEQGMVTRFGCHLPLSKDFARINNLGTRHTAALGLSERTDAMCLVVSEEKGTISIARDAELLAMENLEDLQRAIETFYQEKAPISLGNDMIHLLSHNTREKAIAIVVAVLLWLLFIGL